MMKMKGKLQTNIGLDGTVIRGKSFAGGLSEGRIPLSVTFTLLLISMKALANEPFSDRLADIAVITSDAWSKSVRLLAKLQLTHWKARTAYTFRTETVPVELQK